MNRPFFKMAVFLGCAAALVLLIMINVLWKEPEPARDNSRCPDCGAEYPAGAEVTGKCPFCELRKRSEAGKQGGKGEKGSGSGLDAVPVILFSVIGLGVGVLTLRVILRRRERLARKEYRYFRCAKCKRKLRFEVGLAGKRGQCPTCKSPCYFPTDNIGEEVVAERLRLGQRWQLPE
jgi:hypothetical protein